MKRFWLPLAMLVALTTLLAGSASAITLQFTGKSYAPNPSGGPNVGPYSFKLDGNDVAGICNDYDGTIYNSQSWTVTRHSLDDASLVGTTFYGKTIGGNYIDEVDYRAAAWLANQMLSLHTKWANVTLPQREQLTLHQYAIWTIFKPTAPLNGKDSTLVAALRSKAYAANYSGAGWAVFTPLDWDKTKYPKRPQEILIRVPEASVVGLLGLNFGALALLGFVFRRRMN